MSDAQPQGHPEPIGMSQSILQVSEPIQDDEVDWVIKRAEELVRSFQGAGRSRGQAIEEMLGVVDDLANQNEGLRATLDEARLATEEAHRLADEARRETEEARHETEEYRKQVDYALDEARKSEAHANESQAEKEQVLEAHRRLLASYTGLLDALGPHVREILDLDNRIEMARSMALSRARYDQGDHHDDGQGSGGGQEWHSHAAEEPEQELIPPAGNVHPLASSDTGVQAKMKRAVSGLESVTGKFGMRMFQPAVNDAGDR